jgi:hypothetical protein
VYGTTVAARRSGCSWAASLTQYLTWLWCLYVNVPIAVVAAAGGLLVLDERRPSCGSPSRFDLPGVLLAGAGLAGLVYACTDAVTEGSGSRTVVGLLAVCAVVLALFVLREARAASPLLPLHIVRHRARGGVCRRAGHRRHVRRLPLFHLLGTSRGVLETSPELSPCVCSPSLAGWRPSRWKGVSRSACDPCLFRVAVDDVRLALGGCPIRRLGRALRPRRDGDHLSGLCCKSNPRSPGRDLARARSTAVE